MLASRRIGDEEYEQWAEAYKKASLAINNRDQKMAVLQEQIEQELHLVGVTGIEDKLQDEVPDTINKMRNAGIKVWIITGDKIETAVNIGFLSGLLT